MSGLMTAGWRSTSFGRGSVAAIANKQLELMHKYLSEFGLSPVSRSRVSVKPHLGPKPWEFRPKQVRWSAQPKTSNVGG